MQFTRGAIRNNIDVALMYITHDMTNGQWFDSRWVALNASDLGHGVSDNFVERWLKEKAVEGYYERDGEFFRVVQ